jgi:hypothetical protein
VLKLWSSKSSHTILDQMRTDGDSCHKGSEQEANLVSKIEPKYLPDFLMPAKGEIENGGMAGVGVSTTDRLQTPTTASAFTQSTALTLTPAN